MSSSSNSPLGPRSGCDCRERSDDLARWIGQVVGHPDIGEVSALAAALGALLAHGPAASVIPVRVALRPAAKLPIPGDGCCSAAYRAGALAALVNCSPAITTPAVLPPNRSGVAKQPGHSPSGWSIPWLAAVQCAGADWLQLWTPPLPRSLGRLIDWSPPVSSKTPHSDRMCRVNPKAGDAERRHGTSTSLRWGPPPPDDSLGARQLRQ